MLLLLGFIKPKPKKMKKLSILFAAFIMLASVSYYKKDYTCSCSDSGVAVGSYPINNSTKSNATYYCNTEATTLNNATGGGNAITCTVN